MERMEQWRGTGVDGEEASRADWVAIERRATLTWRFGGISMTHFWRGLAGGGGNGARRLLWGLLWPCGVINCSLSLDSMASDCAHKQVKGSRGIGTCGSIYLQAGTAGKIKLKTRSDGEDRPDLSAKVGPQVGWEVGSAKGIGLLLGCLYIALLRSGKESGRKECVNTRPPRRLF